jgi:hypothetical protein
MPLDWCPLTLCNGGIFRAILEVKIINPVTGDSQKTYGIIDTGADQCAVPADFAQLLGHNLSAGTNRKIATGNGETTAYGHTTRIEIFRPGLLDPVYTIQDTPIDFMPNLPVVLLGVENFLNNFVLTIDYPSKQFSIKKPTQTLLF